MAGKIISLFPGHDCYVEPFGGGAAVLLAKPRARLEVYNDIDGDMVNLFRVLRDAPQELAEAIALTPFAREEHEISYRDAGDDVEPGEDASDLIADVARLIRNANVARSRGRSE